MILTVNIHPTAIKVARSGQGGRNVALEMTDATGSTVASIFPGSAEGWDRLVSLAIEGRAMQEQADTDHAIAGDADNSLGIVCVRPADVDERLRQDGEALGRRIAADEDIEPEQLYVVVEVDNSTVVRTTTSPMPKAEAEQCAREDAMRFAGRQFEVVPAGDRDDDEAPSRVPWPAGLCGHPVPPGAWAAGFHYCRDDTASEIRHRFDEAAAPNLTAVDDTARPEDLDDADGEQ